jgi:aminoglycoside phosphotransferase (APT) family kinase protein
VTAGAAGNPAGNPAGRVRTEDAFDAEAMAAWLREHAHPAFAPLVVGTPEVRQFGGGASNLTYQLSFPGAQLILRRPPTGTKARGAHDMGREHDLQASLRPAFPAVPRMVAMCRDEEVIGSEFYVMERLDGTILRRDIPADLGLDEAGTRTLCERAVDLLVDLHRVDLDATGLRRLDRGEGYVARQVGGWSDRYRRARTPDVPDLEDVIAWLDARQPGDVARCLIHNDYRFDNMVLAPHDPTRIVGILDWELATVGDPLMDLASALAYWVQADDDPAFLEMRRQPSNATGMLTRAEVVDRYLAATGLELPEVGWGFYEVFGWFRLAVIGQQIYYRAYHGQTSNPMYAEFGALVRFLGRRCSAAIRP